MDAPNKIYVEVCEDGIFAFPEPPFKESVEYIRADLADASKMEQEEVDLDIEREIENEWKKCYPTDEGMGLESANIVNEQFDAIARHFYGLRNRALEEAARHVYESWMGGTMDDVRRDMVELGTVLNARKEDK